MKLGTQLGQHRAQPSRVEKVLHVEIARGLEIHEHGCLIRNGVEPVEGDRHSRPSRDGREVDDGVGGAADGEQHAQGILESIGGENAIGGEPRGAQPHRCFSRCFGCAQVRVRRVRRHVPGSVMPRVSREVAMVLAVPITAHPRWWRAGSCRRSRPGYLSRSGNAPRSGSPCTRRRRRLPAPGHQGPATSCMAYAREAAPMSWAGTVLSQPPTRTTASMCWARTISSTSMDMRLR